MDDFTMRKRPAAAALVESTSLASSQSKKTKVTATVESKLLSDDRRVENRSNSRPREVISVATTSNSGDTCSGLICSVNSLASRGSSDESLRIVKDGLRFVDLEAKNELDISSACINGNKFSRGKTPSSELPTAETARERPSEAEIEEFFSGVEKQVQQRFAEKYNYDIVKDVPLEGRYRWVRLRR